MIERITKSGPMTPMEEMPTADFAVPNAAPKLANAVADVTPMKPARKATGDRTAESGQPSSNVGERKAMHCTI